MKSTDTVQPSDRTLAEKAVWTAPELIDLSSDLGDVHLDMGIAGDASAFPTGS